MDHGSSLLMTVAESSIEIKFTAFAVGQKANVERDLNRSGAMNTRCNTTPVMEPLFAYNYFRIVKVETKFHILVFFVVDSEYLVRVEPILTFLREKKST